MNLLAFFNQLTHQEKMGSLDPLTQIPNRYLLNSYLDTHILSTEHEEFFGIFLIDIDYFKHINDTFGHFIGDRILIHVAKLLQASIFKDQPLGQVLRFGGDEFLVIHQHLGLDLQTAQKNSLDYARQLLSRLSETFQIDQVEYDIQASIGFQIFQPTHHLRIEDLQQVDFSLYQAKKKGRHQVIAAPPTIHSMIPALSRSKPDEPIDFKAYRLNYQALYDVHQVCFGLEAFLRWQHPQFGLLTAKDFLTLISEHAHILEFGEFVLGQVFDTLHHQAKNSTQNPLTLTMNMSPSYFLQRQFLPTLQSYHQRFPFDLKHLIIEFSALDLPKNIKKMAEHMHVLVAQGVQFCIDDMGASEVSLNELLCMPIQYLKMDALLNQNERTLPPSFKAMIAIAQTLDMPMIAKNIETREKFEQLKALGCTYFQGNYFGPAQDFEAFDHTRG